MKIFTESRKSAKVQKKADETKKSEAKEELDDVHRKLADLGISSNENAEKLEPELCDEMSQLKVEVSGKKDPEDGLPGQDEVQLNRKKDKQNWLTSSKLLGVGQFLHLLSEPVDAGNESDKSGTKSGTGSAQSADQTNPGTSTSGKNVFLSLFLGIGTWHYASELDAQTCANST